MIGLSTKAMQSGKGKTNTRIGTTDLVAPISAVYATIAAAPDVDAVTIAPASPLSVSIANYHGQLLLYLLLIVRSLDRNKNRPRPFGRSFLLNFAKQQIVVLIKTETVYQEVEECNRIHHSGLGNPAGHRTGDGCQCRSHHHDKSIGRYRHMQLKPSN